VLELRRKRSRRDRSYGSLSIALLKALFLEGALKIVNMFFQDTSYYPVNFKDCFGAFVISAKF
jgi:hypothetical protein